MMNPAFLKDDLKRMIQDKQVAVLVGTGVSRAASGGHPAADWKGLLRNGLDYLCGIQRGLPSAWVGRVKEEIESYEMDDLLSAATKIHGRLSPSGEYGRWLRESVGRLPLKDDSVPKALRALGAPLFTTNYDDLLRGDTAQKSVTWRNFPEIQRVSRSDSAAIVHLHGHWSDPSSVILDLRSYERILHDQQLQATLRALLMNKSLLYVGFGSGLDDPNFGELRAWSRQLLSSSEYRSYRLARTSEAESIQNQHLREERTYVLPYGDDHSELAPFLLSLIDP